MTKIYINTLLNQNVTMDKLLASEQALANSRYYFNQVIPPDDFINKKYLEWFNTRLKSIQDEIYNIRNYLHKSNQRFDYRYNAFNETVSKFSKDQIRLREGIKR